MKNTDELVKKYKTEVESVIDNDAEALNLLEETDFHALTIGWAMAQGLSPDDAYAFATHIRYNT